MRGHSEDPAFVYSSVGFAAAGGFEHRGGTTLTRLWCHAIHFFNSYVESVWVFRYFCTFGQAMSDTFLNMWGLLHMNHGFILSSERPRIMAMLRDAAREKRPGERLRRRFMRSSTSHAAGRVLRRMFPNRTLPDSSATQRLVNLLFRALHASAKNDATDQKA